jgi:hypothetical protein
MKNLFIAFIIIVVKINIFAVNPGNNNKIQLIFPDSNVKDGITVLFNDRTDSTKKIFAKINSSIQRYSLSPSLEYIAITTELNNKENRFVNIYNNYGEIIKKCFIDSMETLHLSNDLRIVSEGNRFSQLRTQTSITFYDSSCTRLPIFSEKKFGSRSEGVFTETGLFYYLVLEDSALCYENCNTVLFIFNKKFKVIGKKIFPNAEIFPVLNLKAMDNDNVSVEIYSGITPTKKIIDKNGIILNEN